MEPACDTVSDIVCTVLTQTYTSTFILVKRGLRGIFMKKTYKSILGWNFLRFSMLRSFVRE